MPVLQTILALGVTSSAITFDDAFGDHMVLQQAPARAAVFGTAQGGATSVQVTVSPSGGDSYVVHAELTADSTGAVRWKALLNPTAAGGDTTITAECVAGCDGTANVVAAISNVAHGDVWYCGGQSNMALNMQYTFTRNDTIAAIRAGKYTNVRFSGMSGNMNPAQNWTTAADAAESGALLTYSATCWYFAEELTDALGAAAPPIGLIHTAFGGSTIEQWLSNASSGRSRDSPSLLLCSSPPPRMPSPFDPRPLRQRDGRRLGPGVARRACAAVRRRHAEGVGVVPARHSNLPPKAMLALSHTFPIWQVPGRERRARRLTQRQLGRRRGW